MDKLVHKVVCVDGKYNIFCTCGKSTGYSMGSGEMQVHIKESNGKVEVVNIKPELGLEEFREQLLELSKVKEIRGYEIDRFVIRNDKDGGYIQVIYSNKKQVPEFVKGENGGEEEFSEVQGYALSGFTAYIENTDEGIKAQQGLIDSLGITNIKASGV